MSYYEISLQPRRLLEIVDAAKARGDRFELANCKAVQVLSQIALLGFNSRVELEHISNHLGKIVLDLLYAFEEANNIPREKTKDRIEHILKLLDMNLSEILDGEGEVKVTPLRKDPPPRDLN